MDSAINIALSGLNAASFRIANSANNVANVNTTATEVAGEVKQKPYVPTDVVQKSVVNGGVAPKLVARDPASITVADPNGDGGTLEVPNVDLADEVIAQKMATYNFQGSLKVLKVADEMLGTLVDIKA